MKEFKSINDILDFAIDEEQKAVDFYSELAENSKTDEMREVFEEFAQEEVKHKARLIGVKEKGLFEVSPEKIADLKIADYLVNVKATTTEKLGFIGKEQGIAAQCVLLVKTGQPGI